MDLIKKFSLPIEFNPPAKLDYEDIVASPLTRNDLREDLAAVNSSIETIQRTRGGSWPVDKLTEEFNILDLAWHEREFRDRASFAYVVHTNEGQYVGCFYLYPIGERTKFSDDTQVYDVDASWWVTTPMYAKGYYKKLQTALEEWLENEFPFKKIYYSNLEK